VGAEVVRDEAIEVRSERLPVPRIIMFQLLYVALALAFNAVSFTLRLNDMVPLAPTALGKATILFAIYLFVLFLGYRRHYAVYRVSMVVFVVLLTIIGIIPHVQRGFMPGLYFAQASWVGAIAINTFGITMSALGAIRGIR